MGNSISIRGAKENNLQGFDLDLPRNQMTVITGVSGSGKSSLAFDTIFKEGQRKYIESLSAYARQFIGHVSKPNVESIHGLSPTIAIDQKTVNRNPRSTVGTITGIYDFFRLLYARLGTPHCPQCGVVVKSQSIDQISQILGHHFQNQEVFVIAPVIRERKGEYRKEQVDLREKGYKYLCIDGEWTESADDIKVLDRYVKHDIDVLVDRIFLEEKKMARLRESLEKAVQLSGSLIAIKARQAKEADEKVERSLPTKKEKEHIYSTAMACAACNISLPELEPRLFSFNNPQGACPTCEGIGLQKEFDAKLMVPDTSKSIREGAIACITDRGTVMFSEYGMQEIEVLAKYYGFSLDTPWNKLSEKSRKIVMYGSDEEIGFELLRPRRGIMKIKREKRAIRGVVDVMQKVWDRWHIPMMEKYMHIQLCPSCNGKRLSPAALAVRYHGKAIDEISTLSIGDAADWVNSLTLDAYDQKVGRELFKEIKMRLTFLRQVGLDYLNFNRSAATLSGGEGQRIRLASQVGSGLQGVLYVLDEPSIGLHARDNLKLLQTLHALRDLGNTLIVVEHDEETMKHADYLVDIGPGAGVRGGKLMAHGSYASVLNNPNSPTGMYLRGEKQIPTPKKRRAGNGSFLKIIGAKAHNLKNVDVQIPLGCLVGITGVSGSGKSTLVDHILYKALAKHFNGASEPAGEHHHIEGLEHLGKMIEISQSPIGRTPRSNPATYTGVFGPIRDLFAKMPESKLRGYTKSRFSFNVKGGRCESCGGSGVQEIDMQLLMSVTIPCEECGGKRFNDATLEVHFKGKSIRDVLEMTVDTALDFFKDQPEINRSIAMLHSIGLGYIRLGQPSTTLSGGEAQRVKLSTELQKTTSIPTLYLLDEPTTGLHFEDVALLLDCMQSLVERGHSVVVIEHNLDVIRCVDHIIDLGPEGGHKGGRVIATGTPEKVIKVKESYTGQALLSAMQSAEATADIFTKQPTTKAKKNFRKTPDTSSKKNPNFKEISRDIEVKGAFKHNLKNISVSIPHNKMTVITGVSGSGKSTLAFDTIFAEGQRRFLESLSSYARRFLGKLEKGEVDEISGLAPAIAIDQVTANRSPKSTVATTTEIYDYFRLLYARLGEFHCPQCSEILKSQKPLDMVKDLQALAEQQMISIYAPLYLPGSTHDFFLDEPNHLHKAVESLVAQGFHKVLIGKERCDLEKIPSKIAQGTPILLYIDSFTQVKGKSSRVRESLETALDKGHGIAVAIDAKSHMHYLSTLTFCPNGHYFSAEEIEPKHFSFNSHFGMCMICEGMGEIAGHPCTECQGTRLKSPFNLVTVGQNSIGQVSKLTIETAIHFFEKLKFPALQKPVAEPILHEICGRLKFLESVGLGYLSLDRSGNTLSGGEAQRIRLASQIGSGLEGVLYVLDEPTIGLHPQDTAHLLSTLRTLQTLGNTLLIVEHDPAVIRGADHIIEMGPFAGEGGGEVMYSGSYTSMLKEKNSLTGAYLSGKNKIESKIQSEHHIKFKPENFCTIENINLHNLQNFSVSIPMGGFVVLAGVSGSGKSTLLLDATTAAITSTLNRKRLPKAVGKIKLSTPINEFYVVDQSPIGTTPRSSPITYGKVFDRIRDLFAATQAAKLRGFGKDRFSINTGKGRCSTCEGMGQIRVEMHFLSDVWVTCDACKGKRFNQDTLQVEFKGKSIADVLAMRVTEAKEFFAAHRTVYRYLDTLDSIGLGYIRIGQSATTFSGGEAQRVKLAAELARGGSRSSLYILDEPTTGLHMHDVNLLYKALRALVDKGHTVWVIEHHLDIIKNADWVIELGLDKNRNAKIAFEGNPKDLAKAKTPTGQFLT